MDIGQYVSLEKTSVGKCPNDISQQCFGAAPLLTAPAPGLSILAAEIPAQTTDKKIIINLII